MSTPSRKRLLRILSVILIAGQLAVYGPTLHANPRGGTVASGQATIQEAGALTTITQGTDKAIINWQSFGNAAHETVRFAQPQATSVTLNRVVGVDPSSIQGAMQANGRLFLINPNGIIFGPTSRVDVAGLVASTLAISNADFLRGNYTLVQEPGRALASVINAGRITAAPGGYVALVAPIVDNQGHIVAAAGRVVLAGTAQAVLHLDSAGLVSVQVPASAARDVVLQSGDATDLLARAVNNSNVVEATGVRRQGGTVVLTGGEGIAVNQGTISVSGAAGQAGGRVHIQGTRAAILAATSRVEAKGAGTAPGGAIEVSSQGRVALAGTVDTSSPAGKSGTLLIDPDEIIVTDGAGRPGTVSEDWIESQLSDVTLVADNSITIEQLGELELQPSFSLMLVALGATAPGAIIMQSITDVIRTTAGGGISVVAAASGGFEPMIRLGSLEGSGGVAVVVAAPASPPFAAAELSLVDATSALGPVVLTNPQGFVSARDLTAKAAVIAMAGSNNFGWSSISLRNVLVTDGPITLATQGGSGSIRAHALTAPNAPVQLFNHNLTGDIVVDQVTAHVLGAIAPGDVTVGTSVDDLIVLAGGTASVVETDGLRIVDAQVGADLSVRAVAGDIVVNHALVKGTVHLDAAGSIIGSQQPTFAPTPPNVRASRGDFHAGGDIQLATQVVRLDATAGSAETRSGSIDIVNHGWLHLLGTITAGDDVRLDLRRDPEDQIGALLVLLGGPRGGIISGRTVRLDVGAGEITDNRRSAPLELTALAKSVSEEQPGWYELLTSLARALPPFVAVLDGQLFDNVLDTSVPTTNIAAQNKIAVRLHGPKWMPQVFGLPEFAPIELTARSPEDVRISTESRFDLIGVNFTDDVFVRTLASTAGTFSLYAPLGSVRDANGDALNLNADSVAVRARGGIGAADDALETRIGNQSLWATAQGGGIWLVEQDGLHLAEVRATGDVDIRSLTGDLLLGRVVSGGSIHLEATGSILDHNGDLMNLVRRDLTTAEASFSPLALFTPSGGSDSQLVAGGFIGTRLDPIEVRIEGGTLSAGARGTDGCWSIVLAGEISPVNELSWPWLPPGNISWNGVMVYQGCRVLIPSGGPDTPEAPGEPGVIATTPVAAAPFVLPGALDPSQALKTMAGPTRNASPSNPEPLIDTTMLP